MAAVVERPGEAMADARNIPTSAHGHKSVNLDCVAQEAVSALRRRLTPTQLASHLACPHLTQLDEQRRKGLLRIEFSPDARLDALRERGRQH